MYQLTSKVFCRTDSKHLISSFYQFRSNEIDFQKDIAVENMHHIVITKHKTHLQNNRHDMCAGVFPFRNRKLLMFLIAQHL